MSLSNLVKRKLREIANEFDSCKEPFSEHIICDKMREEGMESDLDDFEELAESIAFRFSENYGDKNYNWGTYYGPLAILGNDNGTVTITPSLDKVTPEMIAYWEKRATEVNHPILKARYADLVWDFSEKVTGKKPNYKLALQVIESNLEIAKNKLHKYNRAAVIKLERALDLSIALNQPDKITETKKLIFDFENETAEIDKPGSWGIAYDLLMDKKGLLDVAEIQQIISNLESRLSQILSDKSIYLTNPFTVEACALRLANYYRSQQIQSDLERVLTDIERVYMEIDPASSPNSIFSLEKLQKMYFEYGLMEHEKRILRLVEQAGSQRLHGMQTVKVPIKFDVKEVDDFIEKLTSGNLKKAVANIVSYHVPRRNKIEQEIKDLIKQAPLTFTLKESLVDETGRKIAEIGSIDSDPEGKIINHIRRNLSFEAWILNKSIDSLFKKHELDLNKILDFLYESPVYLEERRKIISRGIQAYIEKDYIVALSVLIPQIENIFRTMLNNVGHPILKPNRITGGLDFISLDSLLAAEPLENIYNKDFTAYFRILLTDPRGLNLRNDVCHGIPLAHHFDELKADRVFHILLCLGILRLQEKDSN